MSKRAASIWVGLALLAGIGIGWIAHAGDPEALAALLPDSVRGETAVSASPDHVCPMHPEVLSVGPSSCPICGMDLVPRDTSGHAPAGGDGPPAVHIRPEVESNIGVRTAAASRMTLERRIDTVGYVEYDRTRLSDVYGPADGYIKGLTLRSEGERVKKGQFLFKLDSPTLSTYYDETHASHDGIVAALNVIEGEFVTPTTKILTLADLSSVWILADVFEGQSHWIRLGQRVTVHLPFIANREWSGTVQYVYPNLDPETRTLKIRIRVDNPDEVLKPNMLTEVSIYGSERQDVLAIPREALIETGKHQRVVVAEGSGHFRPRHVSVGMEQGKWVEILEGLDEGEKVVVSGQFLLDSESSLEASLLRMSHGSGS